MSKTAYEWHGIVQADVTALTAFTTQFYDYRTLRAKRIPELFTFAA